ncbi:Auxin Efflux Carrier [Marinobacterium lacunae]|uniref:Auxin Efflux Carrier n=1 Tax=Marinobacterium lacunae TaxID=1232683 RepID=A0A081FZ00_9GAMM|nr:AEC family transporter [Marinobacterium lacunae]KEA63755.1 Auxin Efflux Carrier [Marinobacterium lacunae]
MAGVLGITAPIFLVILIGYGAVKSRIISPSAVPEIGRVVLYFTLPALIFSNLATMRLDEVIDGAYISAYALGSLATLLIAMLFFKMIRGNPLAESGVKALGTAVPNSVFIGYPVLEQVFSEVATQAFMMSVIVENILLIPLALITIEYAKSQENSHAAGQAWKPVLQRLIRNPILMAIFAGLSVSALSLPVPDVALFSLDILGKASAALALFVIGGSLVGNEVRGNLTDIGLVMSGKLTLHPLILALVAWMLPTSDPALTTCAILMAAMPMMSIFPIIGSNYGFGQLCASILVATTTLSFFTISLAMYLLL